MTETQIGTQTESRIPKRYQVELDLKKSVSNTNFEVVENDTENYLTIILTDNGVPVDLTNQRVMAVFSHSGGTFVQDSTDQKGQVSIDGNRIHVHLKTGSFSRGTVECEIKIYNIELKTISTTPTFNFSCRASLFSNGNENSGNNIGVLNELLQQVTNAVNMANNAVIATQKLPKMSIAYSVTNPNSDPNATLTSTPSDYLGIFFSENGGEPTSANDYIWCNTTDKPTIVSAAVSSTGELEFTFSDAQTLTTANMNSFVSGRISTACDSLQERNFFRRNISVERASFESDTTLRGYPYKCEIPITGVTENHYAEVVFAPEEAMSGNFAPIALVSANMVEIFSKKLPESDFIIPTIKVERMYT